MWVDGQPRVACVTPVGRVAGRAVTTIEGLDGADRWAESFCANGGSQCGFCTSGIIMRVAALTDPTEATVRQALLAHLCRCTGWHPIVTSVLSASDRVPGHLEQTGRGVRASLEGGVAQDVGAHVALGRGGFADDTAPPDALVALLDVDGEWVVGESLAEARRLSAKIQGRRTTASLRWPIELPPGAWMRTLQTTWVEPAYLEPDAAWCAPGGTPASSLGNGGAFGGKVTTEVGDVARRLADRHGRAVRVLFTREDVVRRGPKRPPIAAGVRADGTGIVRVARTPGIVEAIGSVAPGLVVEEVDVVGPPTTRAARAAGWAEAAVLLASISDHAIGDRCRHGHRPERGDGLGRDRRRRRCARPCRMWGSARRGRAPQLLHRRRAHGARLGAQRGSRGRRRRDTARPHDPLVRGATRRRHPTDPHRDRAR